MEKINEKNYSELEAILNKKAEISFKDRLMNIGSNIADNTHAFLPLAISLGVGYLIYWDIKELVNHTTLTESYQGTFNYISGLHDSFSIFLNHNLDTSGLLTPEIMEAPNKLIQEGSEIIYHDEAKEILKSISENKDLFNKNAELKPALEYLVQLKSKLFDLANSGKESFLSFGAILGVASELFAIPLSIAKAKNKAEFKSRLRDKKHFKNRLKIKLP